ncbi:putative phosphoserine phosphatase-like protein [Gorilla gorilla gorilla]|uniref:putative phosphoserine phosphatase-like protein n=1 Tax=Gorilla gorilla gorilla TaxID=9595 RepID=UPI0024459AAE|nr:putative phosphoserine phosphatase-like protein [Gorilla gorilla gorilla]
MASASCSPGGALASPEPGRKILPRMISHSELRKLFYSADAVCFDVDSTVISEEGIGICLGYKRAGTTSYSPEAPTLSS